MRRIDQSDNPPNTRLISGAFRTEDRSGLWLFCMTLALACATIVIVLWPDHLGQIDRDTGFQWLYITNSNSGITYPHHPILLELLSIVRRFLPNNLHLSHLLALYGLVYLVTVAISWFLMRSLTGDPLQSALPTLVICLNPAFLFILNTLDDNLFVWPFILASIYFLLMSPMRANGPFLSGLCATLACGLGTTALGWALAIGVAWLFKPAGRKTVYLGLAFGIATGLAPLVVKDITLGLEPYSSFVSMFRTPSDAYFGKFRMSSSNFHPGIRMAAAGLLASAGPIFIDPLTMVSKFQFPLRFNASIILILLFLSPLYFALRNIRKSSHSIPASILLVIPPVFYLSYVIASADDALQERTDWVGPWLALCLAFASGKIWRRGPEAEAPLAIRHTGGGSSRVCSLLKRRNTKWLLASGLVIAISVTNAYQMLWVSNSYAAPHWRAGSLIEKDVLVRKSELFQSGNLLEFGRWLSLELLVSSCHIYKAPLDPQVKKPIITPWQFGQFAKTPDFPLPEIPGSCEPFPFKLLGDFSESLPHRKRAQIKVLPPIDRSLQQPWPNPTSVSCAGLTSILYQCNDSEFTTYRQQLPAKTIKIVKELCQAGRIPLSCHPGTILDCTGAQSCIARALNQPVNKE